MKEKKSSGKTPSQSLYIKMQENEKVFFTRFVLSLYSAQVRKKTIIPSIPMIHEGKNWKNHKKGSGTGGQQSKKKKKNAEGTVQNSAPFCEAAQFSSFFCSSFLLVSDLQC